MAAQLNLAGIPPHIQQLITQLLPPIDEDPFEGIIAQLSGQAREAEGAAQSALGPLQALQTAPAPQTSPGTDAMTELLGGLSQMLAPEMGGLQQARGARAGVEDDMQKRRTERLSQLEKNADELADRAKRLGNLELEMKWRQKAEGFKAKAERDSERGALAGRMMEGAADRGAAMARTQYSEGEATKRASIAQGTQLMRYGLRQKPDGSIEQVSPKVTRKDWQARESRLINSIQVGKKGKQNTEGLEASLRDHYSLPMEDEAQNPALYAQRLGSYQGTEQGFKVLGFGAKGQKPFTPEEVAHQIVLRYGADPDTEEGQDVIFDALRRGLRLSREQATGVLKTLYGGQ